MLKTPPPVLEQAAPVQDNGLTIEDGVRRKRNGTKKYSASAASVGINNSPGGPTNGPGLG